MDWFRRHITLEGLFYVLVGGLALALALLAWVAYNIMTVV